MRRLLPWLALVLIHCGGCETNPPKVPEAIEVTGTVTLRGKPVTDVVLNLQPAGPGHPVVAPVANGKFKALVTPGKYNYFISQGESPAGLSTIPKMYHQLNEDTVETRDQVVVEADTSTIEVAMD